MRRGIVGLDADRGTTHRYCIDFWVAATFLSSVPPPALSRFRWVQPRTSSAAPAVSTREAGHLRRFAVETHVRCAFLIVRSFVLRWTTTASAAFSLRSSSLRRPFGREAGYSQGKSTPLPCTTGVFTRLSLDHRGLQFIACSPRSASPLSASCTSARKSAPRFLPTLGYPHAVAASLQSR
jgi:hypothetical protein